MSSQGCDKSNCPYAMSYDTEFKNFNKQIEDLASDVDRLSQSLENYVKREEFERLVGGIQEQIKDLKKTSSEQAIMSGEIKEALARLETNYENLSDQFSKYTDKMDKIYDLLINFKHPQGDKIEQVKSESINNKDNENDMNVLKKYLSDWRTALIVVFLLVAIIIYLLTGNWIVKDVKL